MQWVDEFEYLPTWVLLDGKYMNNFGVLQITQPIKIEINNITRTEGIT